MERSGICIFLKTKPYSTVMGKEIITCYATKVEELGNRNADNGTQKGAKIVDYGRGVNQGFFNKNKVILMYGNVSDSNSWEPKKYFYDEEGNPIYIKIGIIEIFIMDGEVVETKPTGVEIYQTGSWQTERIYEAIEIRFIGLFVFFGGEETLVSSLFSFFIKYATL